MVKPCIVSRLVSQAGGREVPLTKYVYAVQLGKGQKKKLESGAVPLPKMQPRKRKILKSLGSRSSNWKRRWRSANVMIYGLNSMIDYAEQELKVPLRKKHGTKQ